MKLKDALSLARKVNQELNQFRRNRIKPYLPPQFAKLTDISDDSKNFLFRDSIADTVGSLQKENQTKSFLKDKTNLKRKHPQIQQEPLNYQTSSMYQKRNSDQGQKHGSVKSYSRQQTQKKQPRKNDTSSYKSANQHNNTPLYYRKDSKHHKRKY